MSELQPGEETQTRSRDPSPEHQDGETRQQKLFRYHYLSNPKEYKYKQTRWVNNNGTTVRWGTQQMLTPPTEAAKSAEASPRIQQLARPKSDMQKNPARPQFYYSCGRVSQINLVNDGTKNATCPPRIKQLAKHKDPPKEYTERPVKDQFFYSCGRESPVWPVQDGAKSAAERPKTTSLSRHKDFHKDFKPERPLPNLISETAQKAGCPERIESLARYKDRSEHQFRSPLWEVTSSARKATASPRTMELARYKPVYEGYHYPYDQGQGYDAVPRLIRPIPRNARNAVASTRLKELSQPIIRESMDKVQFDPDAFVIKRSTLNAYCTPRIQELSQPLRS